MAIDLDTMTYMLLSFENFTCVRVRWLLGLALYLYMSASANASGVLGDRLVIAVNSMPYSQRQLELYLTIKHSLRPEEIGEQQIVSAANWSEALTVFSEEMMILQEAMRLGSFAASDQLLDQYNAALRKKMARGTKLQDTLIRLAVDDLAVSRTLDSILRVASYRQNRNRQEVQGLSVKKATANKSKDTESKWLQELRGRTNMRVFSGADTFREISPTAGGGGGKKG